MKPAEAAKRLGISVKNMMEHVRAGRLRFINVGNATRKVHRFTPYSLELLIKNQKEREVPKCQSPTFWTLKPTASTSKSGAVDFLAIPKPGTEKDAKAVERKLKAESARGYRERESGPVKDRCYCVTRRVVTGMRSGSIIEDNAGDASRPRAADRIFLDPTSALTKSATPKLRPWSRGGAGKASKGWSRAGGQGSAPATVNRSAVEPLTQGS